MRTLSTVGAALAAILCGVFLAPAAPAMADDYLAPYGTIAVAVSGTRLNVARIDSRNANVVRLGLQGTATSSSPGNRAAAWPASSRR